VERAPGPTLILAAAVGGNAVAPARLAGLARHAEWTSLLGMADSRLQLPALHALLARHGLLGEVPGEVAARLGQAAAASAARNQYLLATLRRVTGALHAEGVKVVLLKGAAILVSDPDYGLVRYLDDLDLLVDGSQLDLAATILERLEFRPVASLPAYLDGNERSPPPREVHHESAHVDRHGLVVELHSRLPRSWELDVLARAIPAGRAAPQAMTSPPEDLLGILAAHALRHHQGDARFLVRHLADVAWALTAGANPALAGARFDQPHDAPVAESLALLSKAVRAIERPSRFWPSAPERAVRARGALAGWAAHVRYRLGTWQSNGAVSGLRMAFPSRAFMEHRYALARGSQLVWPLYLARPFIALGHLLWRRGT